MKNFLLAITQFSNNLVNFLSNSLGIWYFIILNAFGVLAIICKVCEYQIRQRKVIFVIAMLAQVFWALYFIFNGDFVSAFASLIAFVSVSIFSQRTKHKWAKSVCWLILFLVVQVSVATITFKTWKDIFSLTAGVLGVFTYYCIDLKKYRILSLFYSLAWLFNSIFKIYPVALASDVFSTISVSIGILRYDILKRKKLTDKME